MDNPMGLAVEMGDTSKGYFYASGPSFAECDFNGDGFDFSEDKLDFGAATHGLVGSKILCQHNTQTKIVNVK